MPEPQADVNARPMPATGESEPHQPIRRKRRRQIQPTPEKYEPKPVGRLAYLVLLLLTLASYLPIFQSDLIWSAHDQEVRSAYQSMNRLADAWTLESIRSGDPLTASSYFLEKRLPFPTARVHHAINLLLHISAACIFLKVLTALKLPAAFSAALVFALHPTVMQTIFWSGYREELVGLILILTALYFGIRYRSSLNYGFLLFFSALACLLHPAALVLPLILMLVVIHQNRFLHLKDFNHLLPVFCLAVFIGIWTQSSGAPPDQPSTLPISHASQNFFFYIEQSLLPTELSLFHPLRAPTEFTAGAQYTFLPVFLLIPFYVLILANYKKPWARSVFVGLTAYLLLSLYGLFGAGKSLDGQPAHENHLHYISLPFMLVLIVAPLGGIIGRLGSSGRVLWYVAFTILILLQSGIVTAYSMTVGKRASMWLEISEQWPESWVPKLALVETIQRDKESRDLLTQVEQINMMEAAIKLKPDLKSIRIKLAQAYRADGQNAQALRHYRWIARQEKPEEALLLEIADYYQTLDLTWEAQTTRDRIDEMYNSKQITP